MPEKAGVDLRSENEKREDAKSAARQFSEKFLGEEKEKEKEECRVHFRMIFGTVTQIVKMSDPMRKSPGAEAALMKEINVVLEKQALDLGNIEEEDEVKARDPTAAEFVDGEFIAGSWMNPSCNGNCAVWGGEDGVGGRLRFGGVWRGGRRRSCPPRSWRRASEAPSRMRRRRLPPPGY